MTIAAARSAPASPPPAVRVARFLLVLIALDHLVFLVTIVANRRADGGHLTPSLIQNGFLLTLTTVIIFKLGTGHRWARRPATISQAFGITLSAVLWPAGTVLVAVVPVVDIMSVVVVALLWAPQTSRQFFGGSKLHDAS